MSSMLTPLVDPLSPCIAVGKTGPAQTSQRSAGLQLFAICSVPHDAILWKNRYNRRMKLDLPTSILLLAVAASALWVANSTQSAPTRTDRKEKTEVRFPPRIPASTAGFTAPPQATQSGSANDAFADPVAMLRDSIRQLRNVEGLTAETTLNIQLLGVSAVANGRYVQKGQGNPQARWDFVYEDTATSLIQVFDGRFFYRVYTSGDRKSLSCIDLYHVPELPESRSPGVAGPSGWFGLGGLSTALEQLVASFDFSVIDISEATAGNGSMQLVTLRGCWKPDALRQYLRGQLDQEISATEIPWDRLPGQLPHEVELVLGTDAYLKLFPYRITYRRNRREGKGWQADPWMALQLHHVTRLDEIPPETFVVSSDDVQPIDQTADFLARTRMFLMQPVE